MIFDICSEKFIEDIPDKAEVYIYGAGKFGIEVYGIIRRLRPDVKILGFIDTYRSGNGVLSFEEFKRAKPSCDLVVIASGKYWREMKRNVESLGYDVIIPALYKSELSEEQREKIQEVEKRICKGADLYRKVISCYLERDDSFLQEYYSAERWEKIYLEYVDFTNCKYIIEGGVYKGGATKRFLALSNDVFVVGFDIWGDAFLSDCLRKNDRLKVYKRALWKEETELCFMSDFAKFTPAGTFVMKCEDVPDFVDRSVLSRVSAVALDDFVFNEGGCARVDFIKLDIEGAELEAIMGAKRVISEFRPQMALSVYHKLEHYYEIPLYVLSIDSSYKLYFEHYGRGLFDSVMYFV